MTEVWAALAGGALGGMLALLTAVWSFKSARRLAEQDAGRRELEVLQGLIVEIEDVLSIAKLASAVRLPSVYLREVMPLRFHMEQTHRDAIDRYARAVMRYNG